MKKAACVLLQAGNNEFVCISRRNSSTAWGFPGGKIDEGETPEEAACREVLEELSIEIQPENLSKIYEGECTSSSDLQATPYYVFAFLYDGPYNKDDIVPENGMLIRNFTASQMSMPDVSPFSEYNENILSALSQR